MFLLQNLELGVCIIGYIHIWISSASGKWDGSESNILRTICWFIPTLSLVLFSLFYLCSVRVAEECELCFWSRMYSQLVSIYEAWCSAERQQPRRMSHTQTHGCELVNFAVAGGRGRGQRGSAGGYVARAAAGHPAPPAFEEFGRRNGTVRRRRGGEGRRVGAWKLTESGRSDWYWDGTPLHLCLWWWLLLVAGV